MSIQSSLVVPDDSSLLSLYNFLEQAAGICCVLRGSDYVYDLATESYLRFVEKQDLLGKTLAESLPELKQQEFSEILDRVYSSKKPYEAHELNVWFVQQEGSLRDRYANFVFQPILNSEGEVLGIVVSGYDISEYVKASKRTYELEERLNLVVEASRIGLYEYDMVTGEIMALHMMDKLFGITDPVLVDQYLELINFNEERRKLVYEDALKDGLLNYQFSIKVPDSDKKWLETTAKVYYDAEGRPMRLLGTVKDVSEKKLFEEKMAIMAAIVESSDDLILSKGLDGIITSWNDAGERIMGYKAHEMIGQHVSKLIPPDRMKEEDEIIARLKKGERIEHFETKRVKKDGEVIDISLTISPVKNKAGETIGASKIARDVTKQKNSERAIIESEERLKVLIEASDLGTWELDPVTREVSCSPRYLEIFGYEQDATLTHKQLVAHLHPEDRGLRDKAFMEAYKNGVLWYVSRIIWADKTVHWIEAKGKVLYDAQKHPYKVLGTVRDITADMNYQKELESREQKFRLLADSLPQHIWTSDADGNMNYFNQSVFDYSGMSTEELGQEGWLNLVSAEQKEANRKAWLEAIAAGELFKAEHELRRYDGQYRWQLSRAVPQKNEDGNIIMWVGTSTDVHDWKVFTNELEEQVKQRTQELEDSNEELSKLNNELAQFAYVASHDLQEPLRKIQTFSARIQEIEKDNLSDKGKDYFTRLQNASKRMQQLILDLLAYSRANTAERHFEEVDLNNLLESVEEQLKDVILQKNALIESARLPKLNIVRYQFEQLFTNLLTNALKFSKAGVKPHVVIDIEVLKGCGVSETGIDKTSDYYHISFKDNGIGFEPEYSETIFQVFKRLHGKDEYPGTGIGLAIVKKIVENHSGLIRASSKLGVGATFDMYFPVEE